MKKIFYLACIVTIIFCFFIIKQGEVLTTQEEKNIIISWEQKALISQYLLQEIYSKYQHSTIQFLSEKKGNQISTRRHIANTNKLPPQEINSGKQEEIKLLVQQLTGEKKALDIVLQDIIKQQEQIIRDKKNIHTQRVSLLLRKTQREIKNERTQIERAIKFSSSPE